MIEFSLEEIEIAYKKYKSYVYYDNSNLLMRQQIAEFEANSFEERLSSLYVELNSLDPFEEFLFELNPYFKDLINEMSFWKLPKKIPNNNDSNDQLLRNYQLDKTIEIKDYIYHVNAPIELHVISVLWIMKEGQFLVKDLDFSYGYTLDKNDDNTDIVSGLRLFKPYYNEYQKWRDKAIDSAKNILAEKQNIGIISLDLKNFYHSVRLDFNLVEEALAEQDKDTTLTKVLAKIYNHYSTLDQTFVERRKGEKSREKSILPIGFLSSGVLANWYLIEFDNKINDLLSPVYYGRYVDDILLTLPMGSLKKYTSSEKLIEEVFENKKILEKIKIESDKSPKKISYSVVGYESLEIQDEKIIIMLFDKNEPISVLDKFKNEIRKSSSEYRFLPNEDLINESFEEASSLLIYDGSKNKLRSIKEFQDDKFGISSFLAKKIFLLLQSDSLEDTGSSEQILEFFRNSRCLEYASLWEKIFTYFVLKNDQASIEKFKKNVESAIRLISNVDKQEIVDNYYQHLSAVISLAISIRLESYKTKEYFKNYIELAKQFRNARLIRKNYVKSALSELVNKKGSKFIDLTIQNTSVDLKTLDDYKFYPRYIHYHEVVLAHYINQIYNGKIENSTINKDTLITQKIFNTISNSSSETLDYMSTIENDSDIYRVNLQKNICKNKLKIGIANFNIDDKIFTHEYIRKPDIDPNRKNELVKILNQAVSEKVDLIVLPECSIPFSWLHWIVNFAHSKQIGMVFGLEHVISKTNKAYNLIVTLLPVKLKKYNSLFIDIRVKKHYSPDENFTLKEYGYKIPSKINSQAIYNWNNVHFTTFNCFELADINDRAKFKSKVDLIVASEYNRDTKYFSNIIESSARDLHCYFVQSNSAHYGDNRIFQPSSSYTSDILKIKGGENSTLLVGTIDIHKLRSFQNKKYGLQKGDKTFKPTPPDYDRSKLRARIKDCEDSSYKK